MHTGKPAASKPARPKAGKEAATALALVPPTPARTEEAERKAKEAERAAKEAKKAAAAEATAGVLARLPSDLGRGRIMDAPAAAMYWGVSLPHWRRLYRLGRVPAPIKIGERKLGWRVGDLADGIASRQTAAA